MKYNDRGATALETVLLAPVLLLGFVFVVAWGRASLAHNAVDAAARDAARQASISRTVGDANEAADTSARSALERGDLRCDPEPEVIIDSAGLDRPPGEYATVTVSVVCTVDLSDIALPGIPGSTTLQATFTSPIDPLRGNG